MLQTSMGEINLLQGGFTGKVGAVVGEKLHGKYRIQSEIFGKAPLTDKQKIALYNMTYINRFASVLSKAGFSQTVIIRKISITITR